MPGVQPRPVRIFRSFSLPPGPVQHGLHGIMVIADAHIIHSGGEGCFDKRLFETVERAQGPAATSCPCMTLTRSAVTWPPLLTTARRSPSAEASFSAAAYSRAAMVTCCTSVNLSRSGPLQRPYHRLRPRQLFSCYQLPKFKCKPIGRCHHRCRL